MLYLSRAPSLLATNLVPQNVHQGGEAAQGLISQVTWSRLPGHMVTPPKSLGHTSPPRSRDHAAPHLAPGPPGAWPQPQLPPGHSGTWALVPEDQGAGVPTAGLGAPRTTRRRYSHREMPPARGGMQDLEGSRTRETPGDLQLLCPTSWGLATFLWPCV